MEKLLNKLDNTKPQINSLSSNKKDDSISQDKGLDQKNNNQTNKDKGDEQINYYSPFSTRAPFKRWQGPSSSFLKLSITDSTFYWVYYQFENPELYQHLILQSENKNEIIFFANESNKYYRIADECLYWANYSSGPYQRMENGVWLPVTEETATENDLVIFTGTENRQYELNNKTGLLKKLTKKKSEEKERGKPVTEESKSEIYEKLEKIKIRNSNPKNAAKDKEAFDAIQPILEKVNKNADLKAWREAIINDENANPPIIKSNVIMKAFEEITEIYNINFDLLRETKTKDDITFFPIETIDSVKFVLGTILFELCLYPKAFIQNTSPISFCSNICHYKNGPMPFYYYKNGKEEYFKFNCSEKNIIKIQRGFHQCFFQYYYKKIKIIVPDFEAIWKSFNPPDFSYDQNRTKIPKGQKGFLTLASTLTLECDACEVYFALIKDPPTILNHQDKIISKKGFFIKRILEAIWPDSFTEKWWEKVINHKDIIEQAKGATDYFKDGDFENSEFDE